MTLIFTFLIFIISVFVIAYPLFGKNLRKYEITNSKYDFSQDYLWLSALSDLKDDYALGRITKIDYQQQKLILQKNYLESSKKS